MQTAFQSLVILVASVVLALAGMALVRRSTRLSDLEGHRDIAGFVYATVGVIYAVLLAFVCIATWERFSQADDDVGHEADTVATLHQLAQGAVPAERDAIDAALVRYTRAVINDEWDRMARGQESPQVDQAVSNLWATYQQLPQAERQDPAYAESLTHMSDLVQARGRRLDAASGQIPRVVWLTLIAGAVITISFTYLFGVRSFTAQALMTVALTLTVSGVLVLTFVLDDPFRGDVRVKPDALRAVQEQLVR